MSQVYRALEIALEKAKEKKDPKAAEGSLISILAEPVPSDEGSLIEGLEERIQTIDSLPLDGGPLLIPPPHSYSAEQFRKVKAHILHQTPTPRSILVTSAVPKEGKSMVAFNLALSFAQERNHRTILIDADLRKPSLFPKFFSGKAGLSDYLAGEKSWEDICFKFPSPPLHLIPAGKPSPQGAELTGSSRMRELLENLFKGFGNNTYIFLDAPPIIVTSDPIIFSKLVDGIVLVVMGDSSPKKVIRKAVDSIGREKILGIVYNQIHLKPSKHHYQFYDRYYREA